MYLINQSNLFLPTCGGLRKALLAHFVSFFGTPKAEEPMS